MSRFRVVLTALIVFVLFATGTALALPVTVISALPVAYDTNPSPAGSTLLGPLGAVGGIGGPVTFTAPFAGTLTLSVVDCCIIGDVYQAFVDGVSLGFTSFVPLYGPTMGSGDFTVYLTAGTHTWDINDTIQSYVGYDDPWGGGVVTDTFAGAGLTVTGTMVEGSIPEPTTFLLSGSALLGLIALLRKRRA